MSDDPGDDDPVHEVRYEGVDVATFNELQSHNDAVLRDLTLASAAGEASPMRERLAALLPHGPLMAEKRQILREQADAAMAAGQAVTDLVVTYSRSQAVAALEWLELFEQVDELTERGELLVTRPDPEVVRLRQWLTDELRAQVIDGRAPVPYRSGDGVSH